MLKHGDVITKDQTTSGFCNRKGCSKRPTRVAIYTVFSHVEFNGVHGRMAHEHAEVLCEEHFAAFMPPNFEVDYTRGF